MSTNLSIQNDLLKITRYLLSDFLFIKNSLVFIEFSSYWKNYLRGSEFFTPTGIVTRHLVSRSRPSPATAPAIKAMGRARLGHIRLMIGRSEYGNGADVQIAEEMIRAPRLQPEWHCIAAECQAECHRFERDVLTCAPKKGRLMPVCEPRKRSRNVAWGYTHGAPLRLATGATASLCLAAAIADGLVRPSHRVVRCGHFATR